jgi:hypothetical protein
VGPCVRRGRIALPGPIRRRFTARRDLGMARQQVGREDASGVEGQQVIGGIALVQPSLTGPVDVVDVVVVVVVSGETVRVFGMLVVPGRVHVRRGHRPPGRQEGHANNQRDGSEHCLKSTEGGPGRQT